jgi:hypothetical protein
MKYTSSLVLTGFLSVAVFALTSVTNLSAQATEKIIYTFTGGSDGAAPEGALIIDGKGNLYGTTSGGVRPAAAPSSN